MTPRPNNHSRSAAARAHPYLGTTLRTLLWLTTLALIAGGSYGALRRILDGPSYGVACPALWPWIMTNSATKHWHEQHEAENRSIICHDLRIGYPSGRMYFQRISATYRFADEAMLQRVLVTTPEHVLAHQGPLFLPVRRDVPFAISLPGASIRVERFVLPTSSGYIWDSSTTAVTVEASFAYPLILGAASLCIAVLRAVRLRSHLLRRGFPVQHGPAGERDARTSGDAQ